MKATQLLPLLLAGLGVSGCHDLIHGKAEAEPKVALFHQQLNDGRYDEIYATAGAPFREAIPREKATALFAAIIRKLGPETDCTLANWNVRVAHGTTTVVLLEETTFESGKGRETFTFRVSGADVELVGYNIDSADMLLK